MENLQSRDANRGTGRTTAALQTAIDYAKACAKPGHPPTAFLVVSNKEHWHYIKNLRRDVVGRLEHSRRLDFDGATVYVVTPDAAERTMRGYRFPVIVDHSVRDLYYSGADNSYAMAVDMMTVLCQDRLVYP